VIERGGEKSSITGKKKSGSSHERRNPANGERKKEQYVRHIWKRVGRGENWMPGKKRRASSRRHRRERYYGQGDTRSATLKKGGAEPKEKREKKDGCS